MSQQSTERKKIKTVQPIDPTPKHQIAQSPTKVPNLNLKDLNKNEPQQAEERKETITKTPKILNQALDLIKQTKIERPSNE